jgi:putative peptidoglycan lipid II flippase
MATDSAPSNRSVAQSVTIAALLIALGNIASRILGLGREVVTAAFFGRDSPGVNAFTLAWSVPSHIYDLLINGVVSAALVPVFSEYADGDPDEFWRIVSGVFNLIMTALVVLIALIAWQTPFLVTLFVRDPALRPLTSQLVRLLLPVVLLMGVSGLITAVLHARRIFLFPAFAIATFNAGIIIGVLLFHDQLDVASLMTGALIGAFGQVVLQVWGLRGLRYHAGFNIHHPAVRRILKLYAPVALGVSCSIVGATIDRWLASGFTGAPATMRYATTFVQFPLGLIAAAVALAILPTLSRQSAGADEEAFRRTLGMGLKIVLLLVAPATAGLAVLNQPAVALLLERGEFGVQDTAVTALALLLYLPGLPAAAIDQVLIFAFYARKNTLTPNLVQGAAIGFYLLATLPLLWLTQLGFLALVIGNSVQWIGHALLMFWLARQVMPLHGQRLGEAVFKAVLASALMALAVYTFLAVTAGLPLIVQTVLAGGVGVLAYIGLCIVLRVEALGFFTAALVQRFKR